jgi:glucose-6-phosphate isomerase, archaeal
MKPLVLDVKGLMREADSVVVRKLSDMADRFENAAGVDKNKILYRVYVSDFGSFEYGLTVIEPGTVNGEYFMTMGHKHKHPSKEIYIPLKGKGKLILEDTRQTHVNTLKLHHYHLVPPNSWHRLVNTGGSQLFVLTIYPKTAGHDYRFKYREIRVKKQ